MIPELVDLYAALRGDASTTDAAAEAGIAVIRRATERRRDVPLEGPEPDTAEIAEIRRVAVDAIEGPRSGLAVRTLEAIAQLGAVAASPSRL